MRLKEIQLFENNDLRYHWPLNNMAGDTSLDVLHHKAGIGKKPCMDKARAPQLGDGEQFLY